MNVSSLRVWKIRKKNNLTKNSILSIKTHLENLKKWNMFSKIAERK